MRFKRGSLTWMPPSPRSRRLRRGSGVESHASQKDASLNLHLFRFASPWSRTLWIFEWLLVALPLVVQVFFDVNTLAIFVVLVKRMPDWYVAMGVYALCMVLHYVGVTLCWEVIGSFRVASNPQTTLLSLYLSRAGYQVSGLSNFDVFCLMTRARWFALTGFGNQRGSLEQFLLEWCGWLAQTWPTTLTLMPRAGLALTLLIVFNGTQQGAPSTGLYWHDGGSLSAYSIVVLCINLLFITVRLMIVVAATLVLLLYGDDVRSFWRNWVFDDLLEQKCWWRQRTRHRLEDMIDFCSINTRLATRTGRVEAPLFTKKHPSIIEEASIEASLPDTAEKESLGAHSERKTGEPTSPPYSASTDDELWSSNSSLGTPNPCTSWSGLSEDESSESSWYWSSDDVESSASDSPRRATFGQLREDSPISIFEFTFRA